MDARGFPPGPVRDAELLGGGTQNILIRFRKGDGVFVLRRPPVHLRKASNDAIRREARVLAALEGTPVPAPRVLAACPDETTIGAVFYIMSYVDGVNPSVELPA